MINFISFMLTDQCNSACKYCYVNAQSKPQAKLLEVSQVKEFLQAFKANKGMIVSFTGGEVFLYPQIEEVLEFAKSIGLHVLVFTNGLLLNRERFERIKGFVNGFAISLDGPAEVHDANRGIPGAYQQVLEVLQLFKENQISYTVQMTIGKSNLAHIDHVAQIARDYHAGSMKLADLMKVGRGTACPADELNDEELLAIKRKAAQLSELSSYRTVYQTNLCTAEEMHTYYRNGGIQPVYWVDPTGDICIFTTSHKEFSRIGHISEFPFANLDRVTEKCERLAEGVLARVTGRAICDLYEEIELQIAEYTNSQ